MSNQSLKQRLSGMIKEYGKIALCVYLAIFTIVYLGFLFGISAGYGETDVAATVSTAAAAWLATKVTQPIRVAATLVTTPIIAKLIRRGPDRKR